MVEKGPAEGMEMVVAEGREMVGVKMGTAGAAKEMEMVAKMASLMAVILAVDWAVLLALATATAEGKRGVARPSTAMHRVRLGLKVQRCQIRCAVLDSCRPLQAR